MKKLVYESLEDLSNIDFKKQDILLRDTLATAPPEVWKKRGNKKILDVKKLFKILKNKGYYAHNSPEELEEYLLDNRDDYGIGKKMKIPQERRKKERKLWAERTIENYGDVIVDEKNAKPEDMVIRSYMGEGPVLIYKTGELDQDEINLLKAAYSELTGLNYYDTRPVKFKNWIKYSPLRKKQTYFKDKNNKNFRNGEY